MDNTPLALLSILALIPAIMLHEVAHGLAALALGDRTARDAGRLSLNPIRHIDPIGTIALPALLIILNVGVVFGWAKPVPVNLARMRNPRAGMWITAVAGPAANLLQILAAGLLLLAMPDPAPEAALRGGWFLVIMFLQLLIIVNAVVMVFNLLPIPPLDGSRVVASLMPPRMASSYLRIGPIGFIILILLLRGGLINRLLEPVFYIINRWLT